MSSHLSGHSVGQLRAIGDNAPYAPQNHLRGVIAGSINRPAMNFIHPELIIGGMIFALTGSTVLVAVALIINKAGAFVPQLLVSSFLEHHNRRRPFYVFISIARAVLMIALTGSIWLLSLGVTPLHLTLFFIAYLFLCLANGMTQIIFNDMAGRLIFPHRVGSFLGMRMFLGGGVGIVAGIAVIQPILSTWSIPTSNAILASIATVLLIVGMTIWCFCREEPGDSAKNPTTLKETIRRGMKWLREDKSYRNFLWLRMGFRVSYLALVFFIPYGQQQLSHQSKADIVVLGGIMVAIYQLADVLASGVWGKVTDRLGSRTTLIGSSVLMFLAPTLALIAPALPRAFVFDLPYLSTAFDLPLIVYLLGLATLGVGIRGLMIGGNRFLIITAPPHRRPSYFAFVNTLSCPLTVLPLVGAWLGQVAGMPALFVFAGAGSLICFISALHMATDRPMN